MSANHSEGAEPNLTPILDMVFQLITFFMLVINFKGAAMDLSLQLPVLGSARPLKYNGEIEPLMFNVMSDGRVMSYGREVDPESHMAKEVAELKFRPAISTDGDISKIGNIPVVIRADKGTRYETVSHLIHVCQTHGFRNFALSVLSRREGL
jgi:biopolymer transport protein ExbD